jgi:hypothetical protein
MRHFQAYFLLAVLLLSWAERFFYVEETAWVEVRFEMSALEQRIAAQLSAEMGIEGIVQVLPAHMELPLRGLFYHDQAYRIELDHQTYFYTLLDESRSVFIEQVSRSVPLSSEEQEQEMLLIKKLSSEHMSASQAGGPCIPAGRSALPALAEGKAGRLFLAVAVPPPRLG